MLVLILRLFWILCTERGEDVDKCVKSQQGTLMHRTHRPAFLTTQKGIRERDEGGWIACETPAMC
jgi:hypothetical protein